MATAAPVIAPAADTLSIVEPSADGLLFEYNARDTVARTLLGQARADVLWRGLTGRCRNLFIAALYLLALGIGLAQVLLPSFSNWGLACLSVLLAAPSFLKYYAFLNVPLLRKSLFTFDAAFLTAQVVIMVLGESSILGFNESTLFFVGLVAPAYFTIVTSDACHRAFRPGFIVLKVLALACCALLGLILVRNAAHDQRIEVTVLSLWNFDYPVRFVSSALVLAQIVLDSSHAALPFLFFSPMWHQPDGVLRHHDPVCPAHEAHISLLAASEPFDYPPRSIGRIIWGERRLC